MSSKKQNKPKLYCLNHNVMCHETFWNWNAQQVLNLDYENLFR